MTTPAPPREPDDTPWRCRRCRAELGQHVHHRGVPALRVGAVLVKSRLVVRCVECDHQQTWRQAPLPEGGGTGPGADVELTEADAARICRRAGEIVDGG